MTENPKLLDRAGWAVAFLTRLPVPVAPMPPGALAVAMPFFPLVGALVGLVGGAVHALAWSLGLPPLPAALLAVLAAVWLTRGLHEDGLADTADGFGGGHEPARRLEIMRDSRSGSFGVLAIVFSVALRAALVAALATPAAVAAALVAAEAVSRAAPPLAMRFTGPARADGLGAGAGTVTAGAALAALGLGAVLAVASTGLGGVAATAAAVAAAALLAALAQARIGGYTGDVLGAAQQVALIAALLAVVAAR